jgi:transcriptional regulator with XRE-family HTH domain
VRLILKIAIVASGNSQRQIARLAGIPENRFSDIVRGWAEPRPHERAAIAAALSKPEAELFNEQGAASAA